MAKLGELLDELCRVPDFDVGLTGFDAPEVDQLIAQLGADPDREETFDVEAALADESPPVAQLGELFELGRHRLLCGDCADPHEVKRLMLGERAILFATDPPTLVDYDGRNHPSAERERLKKATGRKDQGKNTDWSGSYAITWDDADANSDLYERFIEVAIAEAIEPNTGWYCWHASRRQAMLEGAEVLWPEREPYEILMEQRLREGRASFDSEKQNEPVKPEDCYFRDEDFRYWDDEFSSEQALLASLGGAVTIYGARDPSLCKRGKQHDDTAIITLANHRESGVLYVLDADIRRRKPDAILDTVIAQHQYRKLSQFAFEANQFQDFLADELRNRSRQAGCEVLVKDVKHPTDKLGRIQRLQPLVTSGGIRFSRRHKSLLEQMSNSRWRPTTTGPMRWRWR